MRSAARQRDGHRWLAGWRARCEKRGSQIAATTVTAWHRSRLPVQGHAGRYNESSIAARPSGAPSHFPPVPHVRPPRPTSRRIALAILCLACLSTAPAAQGDMAREIERQFRAGEPDQAMQRLEAAIARTPDQPRLRFLRAVLLTESGRTTEAVAVLEQLTQDHPDLPEPYNNLAVLHAARGNIDRARDLLERALRIDPGYLTALENLGDVHVRLAERAYAQAGAAAGAPDTLARKLRLAREVIGR